MARAWRADYDRDIQKLEDAFATVTRCFENAHNKLQGNTPKQPQDKEQSAAYLHGLFFAMAGFNKHLNDFAEKWELALTQGGYERMCLGEWTDTP